MAALPPPPGDPGSDHQPEPAAVPTAEPEGAAGGRRTRWGVSPETVTAGAAVVIGVCALAVSIFQAGVMRSQTRLMQEQQHMAAWPRLSVSMGSVVGGGFEVLLSNEGVGPAQIRRVEVAVDGRPQPTWSATLTALGVPPSLLLNQSTLGNRVVSAGQRLVPVRAGAEAGFDGLDRLSVSVCYCSVYERCWALAESFGEAGFALPEPVDRCRLADAPGGFEQ